MARYIASCICLLAQCALLISHFSFYTLTLPLPRHEMPCHFFFQGISTIPSVLLLYPALTPDSPSPSSSCCPAQPQPRSSSPPHAPRARPFSSPADQAQAAAHRTRTAGTRDTCCGTRARRRAAGCTSAWPRTRRRVCGACCLPGCSPCTRSARRRARPLRLMRCGGSWSVRGT